ncbi:MAG TPA: TonB-dependent receptor [Steroidobacteraceae bacterium]|nr:TonB-dependent receptor [Steroidobacteraceae bacterium]
MTAKTGRRVWLLLLASLAGLPAGGLRAQDLPKAVQSFNIPAQSTADALNQFSRQSGLRLLFSYDLVAGLRCAGLDGLFSPREALNRLLAGSGLEFEVTADAVVVIKRSEGGRPRPGEAQPTTGGKEGANGAAAPAIAVVSAEQPLSLEEVMVTAQRREESLQKTPIAITALGPGDLARLRIADVSDLANVVPSVVVTPSAGSKGTPNTFIRGMGNTDHQISKDNAVGIYVDGVPIGRNQGLTNEVADLERIEVLRGPQGTLYGRNSTAGAINLITNKPGRDFAFEQQLDLGNFNLVSSRTTLNVPLTEALQTRAVYVRGEQNGWVKNLNDTLPNQTDFNMEDREVMRASLRWRPTGPLTIDYSYEYSQLSFGNAFFQVAEGPTAPAGRQEAEYVQRGLQPSDSLARGNCLTINWDLGDVQLRSIGGYRSLNYLVYQDYINAFNQMVHDQTQTWSEELQLLGRAFNQRLSYVAGLFYYNEKGTRQRLSDFIVARDEAFTAARSTSAAGFAQATWTPPVVGDRLHLTLGARYTQDERRALKVFQVNGLVPIVPDGLTVSGDRAFGKFNPTATAEYAVSEGVNSYFRYATGYRAGGFNSSSTPQSFAAGFGPEDVKSYELGLKADLLQRQVRINVAIFRNDYTDLQVDQVRTPPIFADTVNAGEARMQGADIEATAILVPGLRASLSYALLDAKYDHYVDNGIDKAKLGTVAVPFAPHYSVAGGIQYEGDRTRWGTFSASVDCHAVDDIYSGPAKATGHNSAYSLWNARAQLGEIPLARGELTLAIWGKNLADKQYTVISAPLGLVSKIYGEPRTLGAELAYRY